ncbi:GntR family transcriptional regulator [Paenibacillus eucommiae]|uniref:DNA-binding GntR family transcriptional regulator n=1 Tax=Paenibacillus eucommiae TaxID=1355755 RepID=A0ABS4J4J5_9BACL|nr:GntR family transcriptional regulator [Paenibacillus eucommiae]MBP1993704.1 DNA-binding GntR family transcriptional regulator [Paenibacillus eucommiae]
MKNNLESLDKEQFMGSTDIKERVYLQLKQMIMRREFTPNERIDAVEIAEKLGISRTPVRDALNMLDGEGFITTVPRQGIYVKGVYKQDLIELFQYREMVELFALEAGFDHLRERVEEAAGIVDDFEKLITSEQYEGTQVMESDIQLHKLIVESTQNRRIIESYEKVNGHVQMARAYYLQDLQRIHNAHMEHKELLQALKEGDKEKAKRRLKEHLDQTLSNLLAIIDIYKVF